MWVDATEECNVLIVVNPSQSNPLVLSVTSNDWIILLEDEADPIQLSNLPGAGFDVEMNTFTQNQVRRVAFVF